MLVGLSLFVCRIKFIDCKIFLTKNNNTQLKKRKYRNDKASTLKKLESG